MPRIHPSVVHMLAEAVAEAPGREALVCGADRLTYAEYGRCVAGLARELQAAGARGQRVAIVLGNSADIAVATFAVHAAGAQCVALNPGYTPHELAPVLEDAAPLIAVVEAGGVADDAALLTAAGVRTILRVGPRRLTEWRDQPDAPGLTADLLPDPDWPATLQFTGGTTGRSKGVELTHRAVSTNISQREALLPTRPGAERVLNVAPLYHVYAVAMGLHLAAYAKSTLVIMPRYRADDLLALLDAERITIFAGNPTLFIGLLAAPGFAGRARFADLRLCYSGSAALPEETLRRWEAATGVPICEGYGQTEAGPILTYNPAEGLRKPGSVGVPVPLTEVEVVDIATGTQAMPVGEPGQIRARGPQIMSGYRGLPAESATTLRDGWLWTGDVGVFDADGYLTIRDRLKEMIISAGFNVYPRELEEALHAHPAVLEAAVIGRPDAYRGEVAEAVVALRDGAEATADELLAHLRARLARYKVPAALRFLPRLPRTAVGKIDKLALKRDQPSASSRQP